MGFLLVLIRFAKLEERPRLQHPATTKRHKKHQTYLRVLASFHDLVVAATSFEPSLEPACTAFKDDASGTAQPASSRTR